MTFDQGIGLLILFAGACLILYLWVFPRDTDYRDVEHRENAMGVLKKIYERNEDSK